MYKLYPSLLLGFHGCEKDVAERVLGSSRIGLEPKPQEYDWLGHGVYFWENSPDRAMDFARKKKGITDPAVLGAIIQPMRCFDLLDFHSLALLKDAHHALEESCERDGLSLPKNTNHFPAEDILFRYLDCAVIEFMHSTLRDLKEPPYDVVRGVFQEGHELYSGAGFNEKNHIQLCVRNANCIKGYFRPLDKPKHDIYPELVKLR
ncbi:MAG: hypothetical protein HN909_05665 [Phycisphaerales bacterium]|jgi:hypothetical protein|nr:hypothetical protein [Phycisphaerales bacterium]MBT7171241.1 hypothetical protein [Phycisphaerales bacterium]